MTVHVFEFIDWERVNDEWVCEDRYLIIENQEIKLLPAGSLFKEENMKKEYPDRIYHGSLSSHRSTFECSDVTDKLKIEYPEIYNLLNDWRKFKDFRGTL